MRNKQQRKTNIKILEKKFSSRDEPHMKAS